VTRGREMNSQRRVQRVGACAQPALVAAAAEEDERDSVVGCVAEAGVVGTANVDGVTDLRFEARVLGAEADAPLSEAVDEERSGSTLSARTDEDRVLTMAGRVLSLLGVGGGVKLSAFAR
jgi:hypothetical protein